ncbi:MAG: AlpA family phage regulatory protein [Betaproteobacteria bacterium]|nr:AlpA family phage regulatory protein [Betaproteobacteria bacterium]
MQRPNTSPRTTGTPSLPATGYIRQRDLIPSIVPISSPTLWRWCNAGRFPKPSKLGPRVTAWKVEDVRAWMEEREGRTNG